MKQQSGFTLIELVVVIVLLGILGAAATAKFQDLSDEARQAAVQGIAGELSSASAINYAKVSTGTTVGSSGTVAVADCTDGTANSLVVQTNVFGAGTGFKYSSVDSGATTCATDGTLTCTIRDNQDTSNTDWQAQAALICTP